LLQFADLDKEQLSLEMLHTTDVRQVILRLMYNMWVKVDVVHIVGIFRGIDCGCVCLTAQS